MHSEEFDQATECADCRAAILPAIDRSFGFDDDAYLCYACAVGRGGVYDSRLERWAVFPDMGGDREARRVS